jgi:hypothetical protein
MRKELLKRIAAYASLTFAARFSGQLTSSSYRVGFAEIRRDWMFVCPDRCLTVSSLFFILDRMRLHAVANLYNFGHCLAAVA